MLRTHLGLKIALRNKSESLDIQREKLSALPPALLPLNTAALRFEFQQWKKVENCNQKVQMEFKCWFIYYSNLPQFTTFTSNAKLSHEMCEYWPTLLERLFFYVFVCVCDQKISYDFRNRWLRSWFGIHVQPSVLLHSINTHPKKVFIDRNKAKKCSESNSYENGNKLHFSRFTDENSVFLQIFRDLSFFSWEELGRCRATTSIPMHVFEVNRKYMMLLIESHSHRA